MTSSLFATTVVASFFVVALPHMLPCPVPAARYADGDVVVDENGRRRRFRRRSPASAEVRDGVVQFGQVTDEDDDDARAASGGTLPSSSSSSSAPPASGVMGAVREDRSRRECPVPKPGGMLGEWLGFHKGERGTHGGEKGR